MPQVLQETLQEWLDGMVRLQIDILDMSDIRTPGSTTTSTLFLLKGEAIHLAQLWQLTKQLEALPLVSSWEEVIVQIAPQEYCSFLVVVLAVTAEQWNFLLVDLFFPSSHAAFCLFCDSLFF
jgi:hypothetical protein